jgi:hypothetical protein
VNRSPAGKWLSDARTLEGRFSFLAGPGAWLWVLLAVGFLARVYLVLFTGGTRDVAIWESHARGVLGGGLMEQYRASPELNHPPLAVWIVTALLRVSDVTGIPFRVTLRAPLAMADMGTAFLLFALLRQSRHRWLALGAYAANPVAIILSAYHGNTDPFVALFLVLALIYSARNNPVGAGIAIGASLWIKLPGLLALPAITLGFARWRERLTCLAAAVLTAVVTYVPGLLQDPAIVYERVFAYRGQMLHTTRGLPIWGPWTFQRLLLAAAGPFRPAVEGAVAWWFEHDTVVLLVPILLLAWVRRGDRTPPGMGTTLAGSFAIVYGLTSRFAFQYFAWSIPFWLLAGLTFSVGATLLAGGYIYFVYALLCGDWILRRPWDFLGHPLWPVPLLVLRDAAVLFFAVAGAAILIAGIRREWSRFRRHPG